MALCSRVLRLWARTDGHRIMSTAPTENMFAEEENLLTEEEIEGKRNISRMSERMYKRKVKQEYFAGAQYDFSLRSLRKDYVNFGSRSGINPGICWPSKEEIVDLHDIDTKFYKTFDQLKQELAERRAAEQEAFAAREASLEANLSKLQQWRNEMLAKEEKLGKQEAEKRAKMDELIREVREHIGYNLDPSDPKFKEVMEMKEAERKKAQREAKKLAKKERMMQRLMTAPKIADPGVSSAATADADAPAGGAQSSSEKGDSK